MHTKKQAVDLENTWKVDLRWRGIERPYKGEDVLKLRNSFLIEHTLAKRGAQLLWKLFSQKMFIRALGAMTGGQAVQMVQAGLEAVYASGWQVAADANDAGQTYPDQSLYPYTSMPSLVKRLNNAMLRADQLQQMENKEDKNKVVPIIADAEAGFGGPLNTFELIKALIGAGASAIHLEDQLSSLKKCGHMGGKVLVGTNVFIEKLISARLAADVEDVPVILIARTDAQSAKLIRAENDPLDHRFLTGSTSSEGYSYVKGGVGYAIERGRAFAPYADMLWCETSTPDIGEAREFAQGIHEHFPGKWLAYNCSPSFNWNKHLDEKKIRSFQESLAEMGYKFQFVTLAGFHTLNASMFDLSRQYVKDGMAAYARFQQQEFVLQEYGFSAIKHQSFVGAGYFDEVASIVAQKTIETGALKESTEELQF